MPQFQVTLRDKNTREQRTVAVEAASAHRAATRWPSHYLVLGFFERDKSGEVRPADWGGQNLVDADGTLSYATPMTEDGDGPPSGFYTAAYIVFFLGITVALVTFLIILGQIPSWVRGLEEVAGAAFVAVSVVAMFSVIAAALVLLHIGRFWPPPAR
jgi:hypothetical protein